MLGPTSPVLQRQQVPPEMQVVRHRMREGSGFLAVRVLTDGPTRVLEISDIQQREVGPLYFVNILILTRLMKEV